MNRIAKTALLAMIGIAVLVGFAQAGPGHRAYLGVYTQTVDKNLATDLKLPVEQGAIVDRVVNNSPADEAGLEEDDVIIAVDGKEVNDEDALLDLIADSNPGDEVTVTVYRDGKKKDLQATLAGRKTVKARRTIRATSPYVWAFNNDDDDDDNLGKDVFVETYFDGEFPYIGVSLLDVSDEVAASLGAVDGGVLVNEVEKDSPAEKAGLKAGDFIVKINDREVDESRDVQRLIRKMDEGETARLGIIRDKKPQALDVTVALQEGGGYYAYPDGRWLDLSDVVDRLPGKWHSPRGLDMDFDMDVDDEMFDSEEFKKEMKALESELQELRMEMKEMKKSLD